MKRKIELPDLADLSASHTNPAEAVERAILAVEVALLWKRSAAWRDVHSIMKLRRDLPYVIGDTELNKTQILINRHYLPLGSNPPDNATWVRYEDFPQIHVRLTPEQIANVVDRPHGRALFDDGCAPWHGRPEATTYLDRLRRLHDIIKTASV